MTDELRSLVSSGSPDREEEAAASARQRCCPGSDGVFLEYWQGTFLPRRGDFLLSAAEVLECVSVTAPPHPAPSSLLILFSLGAGWLRDKDYC